jgi:hypothetical protein
MEKAKKADFGTLSTLVSTVFPQISTSIGMNDVLAIAKGINKYHIGETNGFPFSRTTMKIGRMDCVIPTTLESNVIQLHQFLYNQDDYSPSSTVKKISDKIAQESGIKDPGKNAPTGGSSGGKKKDNSSSKDTAPAQTEAATEESVAETTAENTKEVIPETTEQETEVPTNDDGSLIGPGANIKETKEEKKPEKETEKETKPEKETGENPGVQEGPGSDGEIGPGI